MIEELRKETGELAVAATEKILGEKIDSKKDKEIIANYLDNLNLN